MSTTKFLFLGTFILAAGVAACGDDSETTGTGGGGGDTPTTTTATTGSTTNATTTTGGQGGEGGGGGEGGQGGEGGSGPPAAPELGDQLDRMGRPGINTATNDTFIVLTGADPPVAPSDTDTRNASENAYNAAVNGSAEAEAFISTQAAQLTVLDSLDGVCGNQPLYGFADAAACLTDGEPNLETGPALTCYGTLATVLNNDQLWLKTEYESCAIYLGVEADTAATLGSDQLPANTDCGGRRPVDDVIRTTYSVVSGVVGGDPLFGFDDNITAPADLHPDSFPYLADPTLPE